MEKKRAFKKGLVKPLTIIWNILVVLRVKFLADLFLYVCGKEFQFAHDTPLDLRQALVVGLLKKFISLLVEICLHAENVAFRMAP